MKVAVSNIAWPLHADAAVAALLAELGVSGIEIAPTKIWADPLLATAEQIDSYRGFWESRGVSIIAAQSLLFGRPDLTLFQDADARQRTLEYLGGIVRVCTRAGAKALVFGSPKNRRIGGHGRAAVWQMAVDFFRQLGDIAAAAGAAIVFEANPPEYGADFITRASEAIELVQSVARPGFRLHLDTACMVLASDDAEETLAAGAELLRHVHASEPQLAPLGTGGVDHPAFGEHLRKAGYAGWVSVEMRQPEVFDLEQFRGCCAQACRAYG